MPGAQENIHIYISPITNRNLFLGRVLRLLLSVEYFFIYTSFPKTGTYSWGVCCSGCCECCWHGRTGIYGKKKTTNK
jgi:hypothetical protein